METVRVSHRPITWPLYLPCTVAQEQSPWASCQIRKIADAHAPGMPETFSPRPPVSDPDMHHSTCVTHVPWCMLGSLTNGFLWSRSRGKTFPAFPAHAQPTTLRIWKEAHGASLYPTHTSSISGQSNLPFLEYGYQNLTLKTQAQVHGWGQSLKSQIGSNMLSTWQAKLWNVHAFIQL